VFKRGVGVSVLSEYLKEANKEVEVWLQVNLKLHASDSCQLLLHLATFILNN
jgi:hypothetical protein